MNVSVKSGIVSFLLTLTLAIHCLALDGDDQISISFSTWSPSSTDLDLLEEQVSDVLKTFLCEDAKLIIIDDQFRNVCYKRATGGESNIISEIAKVPVLDFIKGTDPIRSYLADGPSNVLVSDLYDTNGIMQGTLWDINYVALQVGTMDIERAMMANFTDEMVFMEHRIQKRLNVSIAEGVMNQRLMGTQIIMAKLGQEFGTLPGNSFIFEETNIIAELELEYKESALILRYIGIAMLLGSAGLGVSLTYLGKRYRLEKERMEIADLDPEYHRGLVTEQGVNLMLERGRKESERMSPKEYV
jgi:hypothetical protein